MFFSNHFVAFYTLYITLLQSGLFLYFPACSRKFKELAILLFFKSFGKHSQHIVGHLFQIVSRFPPPLLPGTGII